VAFGLRVFAFLHGSFLTRWVAAAKTELMKKAVTSGVISGSKALGGRRGGLTEFAGWRGARWLPSCTIKAMSW